TGQRAVLPRSRTRPPLFSVRFRGMRNIRLVTQFDLHQQDCVEGMVTLPKEHVDLIVTSPPYNLGIRYGKFSDRQDRQSYLRWCGEWAAEVRRVLKSSGSFFLNIGS